MSLFVDDVVGVTVRRQRDPLDALDVAEVVPALDGRISAAFQAKYGRRSPGPTAGMVSPAAAATTLRLTRA